MIVWISMMNYLWSHLGLVRESAIFLPVAGEMEYIFLCYLSIPESHRAKGLSILD